MKRLLLFTLLGAGMACTQYVFAQGTGAPHSPKPPAKSKPVTPVSPPDAFWSESYATALASAKAGRGLVLVRLAPPSCETCTVLTDKVLRKKSVLDSLKRHCTAGVYLSPLDSNWIRLQEQGNEDELMASFMYVDGDGKCLLRYDSAAPKERDYLELMEKAIDRKEALRHVRLLESERFLGNQDEAVLQEIIEGKGKEDQSIDSLLDIYVNELPVDSIGSLRVLRFLAMQAPLLNSNANQLLRQDPTLFNQVWLGLTVAQRIQVNNRVITKTWQKAIADVNMEEAQLAATFAANTNKSIVAKLRAFQGIMIEFYYGVGDTSKFLSLAGTYYDRFLMSLSVDSLRDQDYINQRSTDLSASRFVAAQLRKAALRVYHVALPSSDSTILNQAQTWADQAILLYPTPEAMDTRARLSYRMGDKEKAIAQEKKAVSLQKEREGYTLGLEKVLSRMKEGLATIDR